MTPALLSIYARLIARFDALPDRPGDGEDEADLERRIEGVVALITWLEKNPGASVEQYREQVEALKGSG